MNLKETIKPTTKKVLAAAVIFVVLSVGSLLISKAINPSGYCMDATCHGIGFPLAFGEEITSCGSPICPSGAEPSTSYYFSAGLIPGGLVGIIADLIIAYALALIILKRGVKK